MRRDRLVDPGSVHDAVLRDDLGVGTAADLARERDERDRHDTARRQPSAVVGRLLPGDTGTKEALRVLTNAGIVDDRTVVDAAGPGGAPTVTVEPAAGTGADVVIDPASTDRAGRVTLTAGAGGYGGYVVRVTFATELEDDGYAVVLQAADPTAAAAVAEIDVHYTDATASRWQIRAAGALSGTLSWFYVVRRFDE